MATTLFKMLYVVQESKLFQYDVDAEFGHIVDHQRLAIIRKIGDEAAIQLMCQEERS